MTEGCRSATQYCAANPSFQNKARYKQDKENRAPRQERTERTRVRGAQVRRSIAQYILCFT